MLFMNSRDRGASGGSNEESQRALAGFGPYNSDSTREHNAVRSTDVLKY